ncbi:MAG: MMPL family transporter [Eubacteriales bacterium]|nr:MMPL family transporter [Eubacteriales bacterium]
MGHFFDKVIRHRKVIMICFILLAAACVYCRQFISVNYDMNDYLPEDSASTVALDVMEEEFGGAIPNARVMVRDVSISQALDYKEKLQDIEGVSAVNWLDDTIPVTVPLDMMPQSTVETYYQDGNALFSVTIEEHFINSAVPEIRELIGDENCMTGAAVSTAVATSSTVSEISKIAVFAILIIFVILLLTTDSWCEPFVVLAGLGIAVAINAGTNLIFGEISFVTNAAGNILQLAVSLDYSVFLIHSFEEWRKEDPNAELAMKHALVKSTSSILSSGLTTVIGFLALCLMRFRIGPDLGLALAKGIGISLLTVFLLMPGLILSTYRWMEKTRHKPLMPSFRRFGGVVCRTMLPLVCVFLLLVIPSYILSVNNHYYYGSSHIFAQGTQYGDDTAAIEEEFGQSDTYVLMVPRGDEAAERALQDELESMEQVTSVTSLTGFVGAAIPTDIFPEALSDQLQSEHYRRMLISVDADYEGEETYALIEAIRAAAQDVYPDGWYLAGNGVSTYDLMDTVTEDMTKVNLIAIGAVFVVLLLTMRSLVLPVILVLTIETAIWINLSFPWIANKPLFYIAYLIISSVQLGATVDYAILFTERYQENRISLGRRESIVETVSSVTVSILTSGTALTVVGFLLGKLSTHGLLSQLGYLLGRGTLCSMVCVLFVLPGLLYLTDKLFIKHKT